MKKAKILSEKERQKHLLATKKALADGKVITINPEAIINIPVIGAFRDYITEALNYLFTLESEEKVIEVLAHIRNGFKDIPKDANYDPYMNAIWMLMTLITEINHQAAEQGHTIITDQDFDESVSNLVNSFTAGNEKDTEDLFKELKVNYEKTRAVAEEKWDKEAEQAKVLLDKEIKTDKKGSKAESKKSNED
tara:strand:- start:428 stop:1006 length:579 start_codon:yes stop_codon:yes gene_type:complete